jgi:hypothetical protein
MSSTGTSFERLEICPFVNDVFPHAWDMSESGTKDDLVQILVLGIVFGSASQTQTVRQIHTRPTQLAKIHDHVADWWQLNVQGFLTRRPRTSVADLGCLSRIPDPNFFHPGSASKNFILFYFNPKICF